MQRRLLFVPFFAAPLVLALGCSTPAPASPDGGTDAGGGGSDTGTDAGSDAASTADANAGEVDAASPDDAASPACDGGRAEVCNRTDDDCDGATDEGCACVAGPHVALGAPAASAPSLAETTTGFAVGLVAFSPSTVSVQRVSHTFMLDGAATVVATDDTRPPSDIDVAGNGDEIGVLFREWPVGMLGTDHTYFAHLSYGTTGVLAGPVDLGAGGLGFAIDRGSAGGFVESHRTADGIGFGALSAAGVVGTTGAATSADGSAGYQSLAIGPGGAIGIAYQSGTGGADLWFRRFDAGGTPIGAEIALPGGAGAAQRPSCAADATGWAVAWVQNQGSRIVYRLAHVAADGTIDVAPLDLGTFVAPSSSVSIATDPVGNIGAHFVEIASGQATTHFALLAPDGTRMGPDSVIDGSTTGSATLVFDTRNGRWVGVRTIRVDGPVIYDPCEVP